MQNHLSWAFYQWNAVKRTEKRAQFPKRRSEEKKLDNVWQCPGAVWALSLMSIFLYWQASTLPWALCVCTRELHQGFEHPGQRPLQNHHHWQFTTSLCLPGEGQSFLRGAEKPHLDFTPYVSLGLCVEVYKPNCGENAQESATWKYFLPKCCFTSCICR